MYKVWLGFALAGTEKTESFETADSIACDAHRAECLVSEHHAVARNSVGTLQPEHEQGRRPLVPVIDLERRTCPPDTEGARQSDRID